MATNGQPHLEAGPEAGWLGHYSLDKAGRLASGDSLETLITEAGDSGLIWTDPQVKWVELFVMLNLHLVSLGIFQSPFSANFFLLDFHPKNVS